MSNKRRLSSGWGIKAQVGGESKSNVSAKTQGFLPTRRCFCTVKVTQVDLDLNDDEAEKSRLQEERKEAEKQKFFSPGPKSARSAE